MKEQNFVLPIRCKRCGGIFDLWYDLNHENDADMQDFGELLNKALEENFCWCCRSTFLHGLQQTSFSNFDEIE